MHNLTRSFAQALVEWPATETNVIAQARLLLLDGLAVAVAGAAESGPSIFAALVKAEQARPVATVIGHGFATTPAQAARLNGMAMHALDFEPMWSPPNHALSTILPALLALGEQREMLTGIRQGAAVLKALAKGIEAQARLRLSSNQLEPSTLTLHPPGAVGSIASAAACADLLALGTDGTAAAMGIAASRLGGILANVGSMTKALHCGDAAAHGLEAALMAQAGFTADADALGGDRGWGKSLFADGFEPEHLAIPVRSPRIVHPGPAWKLFPSQYATHFGISAALEARNSIADPAAIMEVELRVPDMPYIDRPNPASGLAGKFSWQYTVAVALLDGRVDTRSFTDERRFAPDLEAMLPRVRLQTDRGISGLFDQMQVDIGVLLECGELIRLTCDAPVGSWRRPAKAGAVEAKACGLLSGVLGKEGAEMLINAIVMTPEEIDLGKIMRALRCFATDPSGTI